MNKIICIGGTGQVILQRYVQLFFLGLISEPFEAIVVDADDLNKNLKTVQGFLNSLQKTESQPVSATIRYVQVQAKGDTVFQALTGTAVPKPDRILPCNAFFSTTTLTQSIIKGLFARPALSSLFVREYLHSEAFDLKPNSNVVVVGSIIGGTGGGLIAPILDQLRSEANKRGLTKVVIRAVLLGQYFQPTAGVLEKGREVFRSNEAMVLNTIAEAVDSVSERLTHFCFIGGPGFDPISRNSDAEKDGSFQPWPDNELKDPYWNAVQAINHLLQATAPELKTKFENREISFPTNEMTLDKARTCLRRNFGLIETLIQRGILSTLASDVFSKWVFGSGITELLEGYWLIAAKREGREHVPRFADIVHRQLSIWWYGDSKYPGLKSTFPTEIERKSAPPNEFRRIRWSPPPDSRQIDIPNNFPNQEVTGQIAAAIMLRDLLKGQEGNS